MAKRKNYVPREFGQRIKEEKVPPLQEFVKKYLTRELPDSWHHRLYYDILDNYVTQDEKGKITQNTYKGTAGTYKRKVNKNILMLSPRYHAKSSCCSINYPLWEIYKNPNVRILIVSGSEDIATSFVRAIMNQLETNESLREELGSLTPKLWSKKKWGEKALVVRRDTIEHSPTLSAVGVGGRLVSRRADIIICDDLIDINTARTKDMRAKTKEWYENVLLPILDPTTGRLVVLGTAWYQDDLYDFLWRESNFDIRLKLKALIYHGSHYKSASGKANETTVKVGGLKYHPASYPLALNDQDLFTPWAMNRYKLRYNLVAGTLWPEKWDFKTLMDRKKNMSEGAFNRQFLNEPGSETDRLFPETLIRRCNDSRMMLVSSYDNTNPLPRYGHLIIAIGVDLAISRKATADKTAIAVWGLDERRRRVLLDLQIGRWSTDEVRSRIVEAYHAFHPAKIKVENVAFQDMMRQQLENEDIPVEGFRTTSGAKFNEETGIANIAMLMEQGKLILPNSRKDKPAMEAVRQLKYDMMVYSPSQHVGDALMASWFALEALKQFDNKLKENRGFFDTASMVEQLKQVVAPHRILLLSDNPRYFRYMYNSFVYIYRSIQMGEGKVLMDFIAPHEKFFIFVTRSPTKTCGYIFEKETREIVGKIEGDMSVLMGCNMLEKAGRFFNNCQIIIDRNGEGDAVYLEMVKRQYSQLMCLQPDKEGNIVYEEGFRINTSNLAVAIESFKVKVDSQDVVVRDDSLIKEMGELISIEEDQLNLSFGDGQRIKTVSVGLWLLDNYEVTRLAKRADGEKRDKKFSVPYTVFNY